MSFSQLAYRYLLRKKSKSILLLLIMFLIGSMLLATSMILRATDESKQLIQEKTKAKVIMEIINIDNKITEDDIQVITSLENIASINRQAINVAFPTNCSPITSSENMETDNMQMSVFSYDDLQNDSAFFEQRYRLIAGEYIDNSSQNKAVINLLFAETNGIQIGDTIELETVEGNVVPVDVIGLFVSGSERKQSADTLSVNRVENQIFIDNTTYSQMYGENAYTKVVVYVRNPEKLNALCEQLNPHFVNKVKMTTSETLFQQTKAPLEQITRVTKLMFMLTFLTGTVVITILLCMWMRTRSKEAAIFISIGKSKLGILAQVSLEAFSVLCMSVIGACIVGNLLSDYLEKMISGIETTDIVINISLKITDMITLFSSESIIVLIAVFCSMLPILRANPRDTLSRMEG